MYLQRIFWKNIGPYGNKIQTLEFSSSGGLIMVWGKNGYGKCLSKKTKLNINIKDEFIRKKFYKFFKMNKTIEECTLEDLYKFEQQTKYISNGYFDVETQYGFKKILGIGITAKNSEQYLISTENNKKLKTSPDHLLMSTNWIKTKDLKKRDKILTKDGYENITKIIKLSKKEDLYDIQVEDVHEFYANNIVSHNSFLVNLPKILYYGKLDKFKKDEIANRLNRHGWIRGEIQTNPQTLIVIDRKLSPGDLIVYKYKKGDELNEEADDIGKAGISNYQDYIDLEVTQLPYHIFSNIISLSVNDFKSFVSMSPGDKRIIVDKLFAMEILNKMDWLVKSDLRDIKINIDIFDKEISSLENTVKSASKELEKLKEQVNLDNTEQIKLITNKLLEYKPKFDSAQSKLLEYREKEKDIQKSYQSFNHQKSELNRDIKELENKIKLYDQDKCPTCETPFDDKRFELLRGSLQEKIKICKEKLTVLDNGEAKYDEAFKKIQDAISKLSEFITQIKTTFIYLKTELSKLKSDKPKEFKSIQNIVNRNIKLIKDKEKEKIEYDDKLKYLGILEQLYSDSGVKKKILDSYLPTLNKEIDFTLNELHFPYKLKFNNDFEPILKHLGLDINVDTLSTGEKKKVDLAVLISIIRMLKRKYPSLNIFMLDEVLSSIDGDGIYDIIGLLQKTAKEMMINIFIINHSMLPIEYFDYKIEISKKDGFSDLVIEKLGDNEDI